jgi:hypothetical protein
MANKIANPKEYIINSQFSGGQVLTLTSGSTFASASIQTGLYSGIYVGTAGDLTVKTVDGSVFTLANIQGFVPGLIVAASGSAQNVIGFK